MKKQRTYIALNNLNLRRFFNAKSFINFVYSLFDDGSNLFKFPYPMKTIACAYILCESNPIFTTKKNKGNSLYVGTTADWNQRIQKYQNPNPKSNELITKMRKHSKIKKAEMIKQFDMMNVAFRLIKSKNFIDRQYREEVESYLIKRLNPLLNLAKRDGIFERNYKKFVLKKKSKPKTTFETYKEDCEGYFGDWYWSRDDIGDTETIYHPTKRMYVSRSSCAGEEAESIQFSRKEQTWFWDTNKLQLKYELWRTNKTKWEKELKFR